ncbi:MAG: VapC toxin family PIN domain ribonuclease, partial [Chthoniobacterales bacterium]
MVYAHRKDSPFHSVALDVLAELGNGITHWAIPWPCIHEFLSIVTHPRIYRPPTPIAKAFNFLDNWLRS